MSAASRPSASGSVLRGALSLFSTQPLTWASSFLVVVFLPRYLGDQGLGQWSMAAGIASLAATIALLGMPNYLTRRAAVDPARAATDGSAALFLAVGLGVLVSAGLVAAQLLLGFYGGLGYLLPIALAATVMGTAQQVLFALLVGQERHIGYAWLNAAGYVVGRCAGVGVLIAGGAVTAYAATWCATTGSIAALGWYLSGFRLRRTALDPGLWRQLVGGGLPFLGMDLALTVRNQIDVPLAGMLLHAQAAGWLAAAYRIITLPVFIPVLITTPLLPALSRHADNPTVFQHTLRRSITSVLVLSVPASAMIIALAPVIPDMLGWGPAFQNSVPLMMILAVRQPITALNMVLVAGLTALNRERRWLGVAVVGAIFNPALNLALIPAFEGWLANGAIGAAVVEVATELVMLGGTLILTPRGIVDRATAWMGARVLVAGACLLGVTMVVQTSSLSVIVSLPLSVAAGGLVYVAAVMALQVLRPRDLWAVRDVGLRLLARRRSA